MSLVTQCTTCGTTFRVTQQQLQAQNGRVRCGTCMTVFDGLKSLVSLPVPDASALVSGAAAAAGFKLEPVTAATVAVAPAAPRPPAATYEESDFGPAPEQLSLDDQFYPEQTQRGARTWAAGAVLLALALGGQAAYFHRSDLAAQYPVMKPYLLQFCGLLHCAVAPPQRPRQIAIEASDLQATDKARPGIIRLTATLRNHADYELGFPALDLVLTNAKEHTLARRIFKPKEYLERGRDASTGIPASAEITILLDLDTGDLNPAGFRLDLLPAPAP